MEGQGRKDRVGEGSRVGLARGVEEKVGER